MTPALSARRAIVVGSAGQDGRILVRQLRERGLEVMGVERTGVNVADAHAVEALVAEVLPNEVYYLAAFHHSSEESPDEDVQALWAKSLEVNVVGLVSFLEALRRRAPASRLFYASSSHVFGRPDGSVQDESTPRRPTSVYGITKSAGMDAVRLYRDAHRLHASAGILYNHESIHRAEKFLSMRLVRAAQRAARIEVGSLSAVVDWGWAPDYTDAMQRIAALPAPDDYVIATGRAHSVADFAAAAFAAAGLDWREHVAERVDILRRAPVTLVGNPYKLHERTGWTPSISFEDMVARLVKGAA